MMRKLPWARRSSVYRSLQLTHSRTSLLAAMALLSLAACEAGSPTTPVVTEVVSRVTGRVLLPDGTPGPARVALFISIPQSSSLFFPLPVGIETDARGEFDAILQGIGPAPRPVPDTVRVTVGAVETLDRGPNTRTVIDTVLITLRPAGQAPVTTTVTLRLPSP